MLLRTGMCLWGCRVNYKNWILEHSSNPWHEWSHVTQQAMTSNNLGEAGLGSPNIYAQNQGKRLQAFSFHQEQEFANHSLSLPYRGLFKSLAKDGRTSLKLLDMYELEGGVALPTILWTQQFFYHKALQLVCLVEWSYSVVLRRTLSAVLRGQHTDRDQIWGSH